VATIDVGFVLAVVAFGWGLSLASYRAVASRHDWPMGRWQVEWTAMPITLGLLCALLSGLYATARGYGGHTLSAWAISRGQAHLPAVAFAVGTGLMMWLLMRWLG